MIKRNLKYLIGFIVLFLWINPLIIKANDLVDIYFFYSSTCPHCAAEEVFLEGLSSENDNIIIHYYEVNDNQENQALMQSMADERGVVVTGVPFTIINDEYFIGYTEGYTDSAIEEAINNVTDKESGSINYSIDIPLIGTVQTKDLSLPIITVLLGLIDGFNPCALWVLLFLLSILIGMKDRKRIWVFGLTFILTSAIMYFFLMAAWLNLTIFIGSISWIRYLVAAVAIVGGGLNLRSGLITEGDGCEVVDEERRNKLFTRIKKFTMEKSYILALGGIIFLAISVNIIELLCSAGLPVIYTQILALNDIQTFQYYLYLLLYIVFFMLDDIIVFSIALITMKLTGISTKFGRISHLFGGLLMIIIGILLIFAPGLLMFG